MTGIKMKNSQDNKNIRGITPEKIKLENTKQKSEARMNEMEKKTKRNKVIDQ